MRDQVSPVFRRADPASHSFALTIGRWPNTGITRHDGRPDVCLPTHLFGTLTHVMKNPSYLVAAFRTVVARLSPR